MNKKDQAKKLLIEARVEEILNHSGYLSDAIAEGVTHDYLNNKQNLLFISEFITEQNNDVDKIRKILKSYVDDFALETYSDNHDWY